MMARFMWEFLRKLTGRSTPAVPGTGQRIQSREQTEARTRLLAQARRLAAGRNDSGADAVDETTRAVPERRWRRDR